MPLKTGIVAMGLALALAGAVFAFASSGGPTDPAPVQAATQEAAKPLERSDPGVEPWKEPKVAPRQAEETKPEPPPKPEELQQEPEPQPEAKPAVEASYKPEPVAEPKPVAEPEPAGEPEPVAEPEPPEESAFRSDPPAEQAPESADEPDPYKLPEGAIMALTVDAIGLREVPVFGSTGAWALKQGVGHDPDTSLPWNAAAHKNTYIAGHRVGFPGTASDRVFDELGELSGGDGVVLRGEGGRKYRYEVTESFTASPEDSWVTSRVRNKDLVTLQTCTGPNFSERLIVRAERV